jgi:hypothetical protein
MYQQGDRIALEGSGRQDHPKEVAAVLTPQSRTQRFHTTSFIHESYHGFCEICGSVWPCSRAEGMTPRLPAPVPRSFRP